MAKQKRAKRPLTDVLAAARRNRYKVIHERNLLIRWALKAAGCEAHVIKVDDPGTWNHVLCIHTSEGQLHWKLSEDDHKAFKRLPKGANDHNETCTAAEKLDRLERLGEPEPAVSHS